MKLHRFLGNFHFSGSEFVLHDKELVFQIREILKIHIGEQVILSDGNGTEVLATFEEFDGTRIRFSLDTPYTNTNESAVRVTLYAAILKADHFEVIAQKCTEVGVSQIVPILTKRTIKKNIRHDRIQKIMKEAAEQSGRAFVPPLGMPIAFDEALKMASQHEQNFFLDIGAPVHLRDTKLERVPSRGLFIGPEGGWDPSEETAAKKFGCTLATFGPLTFRAETAAIVGTYLLAQ